MLIYSGTKAGFIADADSEVLVKKLFNAVREKMHHKTAEREV